MFASSGFAATPFSTQGAIIYFIDVSVEESVIASDTEYTSVDFASLILESSTGADSTVVGASTFNSVTLAESVTGSDNVYSDLTISVQVSESATASETVLVEASTFGAAVTESGQGSDLLAIIGVFNPTVAENVTASDQSSSRPLWETINTSQSATWQVVKTQ